MKEFYWEAKARGEPIPHILGLTASPVVKSEISALKELEQTMDAVCRTPTKHREDLLAHSQRPSLVPISFKASLQLLPNEYSESILKLVTARNKLNIMEDPFIRSLINGKTERARKRLERALKQKSTYVQNSMKQFCRRSMEMAANIGSWAADWYIFETIKRFLAGVQRQGAVSESWRDEEVVYLARVFQEADIRAPPAIFEHSSLSDKIQRLIEVLLSQQDDAKGIGEDFCTQPAQVSVTDAFFTSSLCKRASYNSRARAHSVNTPRSQEEVQNRTDGRPRNDPKCQT